MVFIKNKRFYLYNIRYKFANNNSKGVISEEKKEDLHMVRFTFSLMDEFSARPGGHSADPCPAGAGHR